MKIGNDSDVPYESVKLPLDQSRRVATPVADNSYLLLSVSDAPLLVGNGSENYDFSKYTKVNIFSESIAFTGDLLSQHGISLFCNDITAVSPVKINTTGEDGEDQTPTELAKNGAQGGPINFYIQNGSSAASKFVSFVAKGGAGGDNTLDNSQAGSGGDGGHVVRIFQSNCSALAHVISIFLARKDTDLNRPAYIVVEGDPVYSAASNILSMATITLSAVEEITDFIKDLQKHLSDIDDGTNTITNHELVSTIKVLLSDLVENIISKQMDNFRVSVEYDGGEPGSGMDGKTGRSGRKGSDVSSFQWTYDEICNARLAFAHPEQCTMLLDRAKIFYYMGSPSLRKKAAILFRRIVQKLYFLQVPLKSNDPLYKAYTESDIMTSDSLTQLNSIKTDAANLYTQLISGVVRIPYIFSFFYRTYFFFQCYNGKKENWTPRASFTFYKDALDTALADHKAFEDAYIQYHAVRDNKGELQASVGLALDKTSQIVTGLMADIDELNTQLRESYKSIKRLTQPVIRTRTALMAEFKIVEERIQDHFGLSFPQILNALRSLAFAPQKSMGVVEGLDLAYQGITGVPNIDGTPVNKKLIIRKIQYGEATVESFKATLGQQQLDSEFILDDPNATRIMTAEEDLMSFLEDFVDTSLAEVNNEMKVEFEAFVKAILARNKEVLHYNILLKLILKKHADKDTYTEKEKDFKREKIEATDPNLPAITAYMGDIYQSSRMRVMKLLDNLVRSLNFRLLKDEDIYNLAFSVGTEDQVPLTLTSDILRSARSRIENKFNDKYWGYEPSRFPLDFNNGEGKRICLSDIDVERLKAKPRDPVRRSRPLPFSLTKLTAFSSLCRFPLCTWKQRRRTNSRVAAMCVYIAFALASLALKLREEKHTCQSISHTAARKRSLTRTTAPTSLSTILSRPCTPSSCQCLLRKLSRWKTMAISVRRMWVSWQRTTLPLGRSQNGRSI